MSSFRSSSLHRKCGRTDLSDERDSIVGNPYPI
jgi:hypothetical protein